MGGKKAAGGVGVSKQERRGMCSDAWGDGQGR